MKNLTMEIKVRRFAKEYSDCLTRVFDKRVQILNSRIRDITKAKNYNILTEVITYLDEKNIYPDKYEEYILAQFYHLPAGCAGYNQKGFPHLGFMKLDSSYRKYQLYLDNKRKIVKPTGFSPYYLQLSNYLARINKYVSLNLVSLDKDLVTKDVVEQLIDEVISEDLLFDPRPPEVFMLLHPRAMDILEKLATRDGLLGAVIRKYKATILQLEKDMSKQEANTIMTKTVPEILGAKENYIKIREDMVVPIL
jgi:hypothetical protein